MKKNAFATLIKDVLMAAVAWGFGGMLLQSGLGMEAAGAWSLALMFAGLPFGWRWASKVITAITLQGIGIKFVMALILGMFAIFVVIGWDVVCCIGQLIGNSGARKRQRRVVESC